MRITSTQLYTSAQLGIQATKTSLASLQGQASSGLAISKPSDDPVGAAQSMQLRSQQAANTQYATNIGDGLGWLTTADSALSSSEGLLRQASDLAVQGGDGGLSQSGREAIATQLDGLKADLLTQANTTYLGRNVFAGNSDTAAFNTTTYAFSGTGSTVQRRVGPNETIQVDANGSAAFGSGATSVFATIDSISTALRAGNTAGVTTGLASLQTALTSMTAAHATVGSNYSRMTAAKTQNGAQAAAITTQRAGIEDADITKVYVELQAQELSYQASLQITAKVLQPSLLSYLS